MSGPAHAGFFIYAKDLERVAHFYESLLGLTRAHATPDLVVLRSSHLQIIVNAMPQERAEALQLASPPRKRDDAAYKFFSTVPSLVQASETAVALGGEVLPQEWRGPGFLVRNAVDPEGNIFQVRELAS